MARFSMIILLQVVFIYSQSLACEGPEFNDIANALKECPWEELAYELSIEPGDITTMWENCNRDVNGATCCRRRLIRAICKRYYETKEAVTDICQGLERIGCNTPVDKLRRKFFPEEYANNLPTQQKRAPAMDEGHVHRKLDEGTLSLNHERATEAKLVIEQLKSLFDDLKNDVLVELKNRNINAFQLLDFLTSDPLMPPDFAKELMKENEDLSEIKHLTTVFLLLNRYWDYLNTEIIEAIIVGKLKNPTLSKKLNVLKEELQHFMANTTVKQFYNAEVRNTCPSPPEGFKEMVSTHSWGPSTLLFEVERFRQIMRSVFKNKFLYQAAACSMMIIVGIKEGSVKIIMFVPELAAESIDIDFFKDNGVVELEFDYMCIYNENETNTSLTSAGPVIYYTEGEGYYSAPEWLLLLLNWTVTSVLGGAVLLLWTIVKNEISKYRHQRMKADLYPARVRKFHQVKKVDPENDPIMDSQNITQEIKISEHTVDQDCESLGGYACEFVSKPDFPAECPICKQIVRKPHYVTCCHQVFCYSCIFKIQKANANCPMCNRKYQICQNQFVERSLMEKQVKCENQIVGCRWVGMLERYDNHLNTTFMDFVERMDGCKYTILQCRFKCGEARPRHSILEHEIEECSKQSGDCTEKERSLQLKIKKLLKDAVDYDKQLDEQLAEKDKQIAAKDKLIAQKDKLLAHKDEQLAELPNISSVPPEISELENTQSQPVIPDPLEQADVIPVIRVLTNFRKKKKINEDYKSYPFYTHEGGYKMCLWVLPNGYGEAISAFVSIYLCFMKGEHDKKLAWPFKGQITVHLLNQLEDLGHIERIIQYSDSNSSYAKQVTEGEMSQGYGDAKFIPLRALVQSSDLQYLKNDCLKIRVTKVQQTE